MFSRRQFRKIAAALAVPALLVSFVRADQNVALAEVPDYEWHAGCFGTASGNLMGFWDRHGLPNVYTGPTGSGLAPLNSYSFQGNGGIRSLWTSQAGFDGRPASQPGHMDDYWEFPSSFESTGPDPYLVAGRAEHPPDCLGDFMGLSQNKWANLGGEINGNINGYAYNFWDSEGGRLVDFQPEPQGVTPVRDIQSGLRAFAEYRGYSSSVFSQLVDFNPNVPSGRGFTFNDLKAEIDAGYPVLLILQRPTQKFRSLPNNSRANPDMHAMVAYGYLTSESTGQNFVRYRTSWASGDTVFSNWDGNLWQADLPLTGVIGFRPVPKIESIERADDEVRISWQGPTSVIEDHGAGATFPAHWYVVERASEISGDFMPLNEPTPELSVNVPASSNAREFYRVRLLHRNELP